MHSKVDSNLPEFTLVKLKINKNDRNLLKLTEIGQT